MLTLANFGGALYFHILILALVEKTGVRVKLEQTQNLSQKLVLAQVMRQSLDCLQLSVPELTKYVQEAALSNPLLDVQMSTYYETELSSEGVLPEREAIELRGEDTWRSTLCSAEEASDISAYLTRGKPFMTT